MLDHRAGLAVSTAMMVFVSSRPLVWGALDLPILGLDRDWHGLPISPPAGYCVACDAERLWFLAGQNRPADVHPKALPGLFRAQLWRHDVAELFLGAPGGGNYLEFNLAPNGAWWSCLFVGPRIRASEKDIPLHGVETWSSLAPDGSWMAAASIPLEVLAAQIGFADGATGNVTFILESPDQRFLSVEDLGGGEPDFHRPDRFPVLECEALPDLPAAGRQG